MSNQISATQAQALRAVADAITETVAVAGSQGAPGGILYAALMGHGVTLDMFQQIMGVLVQAGRLRKSGELYFAVSAPVQS